MVHYLKLWDRILSSSIMDEELTTRWLWIVMLLRTDAEGLVYGTPSALARMANITVAEVTNALDALMAPDPNSTSQEEEGRRILPGPKPNEWFLVNYKFYRDLRSPEVVREQVRERVKRHRARNAGGNAVTHDVTPSSMYAVSVSVEKKEQKKEGRATRRPAVEEIAAYIKEKGYRGFTAQQWRDHYEANGWKVGKNPMRDWKAAVRTWAARERATTGTLSGGAQRRDRPCQHCGGPWPCPEHDPEIAGKGGKR